MNGKHIVKVSDKRVRYSFEVVRNITMVQGNSGTGKTTLFDMVSAYSRLKERSGVQIICDKQCVALHQRRRAGSPNFYKLGTGPI